MRRPVHIFRKLRNQTRWQVQSRVLPVVLVTIMVLGAFSWFMFMQQATERIVHIQEHQVADQLEILTKDVSLLVLGLEASQGHLQGEGNQGDPSTHGKAWITWSAEAVERPQIAAVVMLDRSGRTHARAVAPELQEACGPGRFAAWSEDWVERNHPSLDCDDPVRSSHPVHRDDWHSAALLAPALAPLGDGGELALLPVLVHQFPSESDERGLGPAVYFLDLAEMVALPEPEWWCVLDATGKVILNPTGHPEVGSSLTNTERMRGSTPLDVGPGIVLVNAVPADADVASARIGSRLEPWVVTRGSRDDLPFTLWTAHRATELHAVGQVFGTVFILMMLLALCGVVIGVNRALKPTVERMAGLARNMESVAKGDLTQRMPTGRRDEVGRLIGYFNLMAVSLDEANRQLQEKAAHLRSAVDNLRAMDRTKDDFLVLISHEVRTPLTVIMGGVEYLKKTVQKAEGEHHEILQQMNLLEIASLIENSGERLNGFMNDALQMASIQASDAHLNLAMVEPSELIELGLCGIREQALLRNIDVVNELEDGADWRLLCDSKVLKVALGKILNNAVRHNFDGGRVVVREAHEVPDHGSVENLQETDGVLHLTSQPAYVDYEDETLKWRLIEIFNTGEPIPADRRRALFEKFELVEKIENHHRGSGLSLPIARAAVENHGGRIFVHGRPDVGNSFYLLLPTVSLAEVPRLPAARLGHDVPEGVGGGTWDEAVDVTADPAGLEVELDHVGAAPAGDLDETGGGVDGPGGADDEEDVAADRELVRLP